ncbi:hypothetical protein BGZ57DRAFT_856261 [Hyaloscypha finlandica]|nr:hypothetical protein BGZ57DRAFT_856261 [Hyaloscypha finlandica]
MKSTIFILATLLVPIFSQTLTHITQLSIFTDLPLCLSSAVDLVYEGLRTSACPQTNPASAASCLCLKTVNSQAMSMSMSIYAMIWCAGISGNSGDQENLSSGLAVFSEYCTEALGGMAVKTAGNTPAQTGAGRTTVAALPGATSVSNQNNSPSSSSPSSSSSSSLSLGEKIAIAVAIPATLAAIVGTYFAYKSHSREKKKAQLAAQFLPGPPRYPGPPPYQLEPGETDTAVVLLRRFKYRPTEHGGGVKPFGITITGCWRGRRRRRTRVVTVLVLEFESSGREGSHLHKTLCFLAASYKTLRTESAFRKSLFETEVRVKRPVGQSEVEKDHTRRRFTTNQFSARLRTGKFEGCQDTKSPCPVLSL